MEIERGKGCALTTAQRYNYSYLMDVRAASEKLNDAKRDLSMLCHVLSMRCRSVSGEKFKKRPEYVFLVVGCVDTYSLLFIFSGSCLIIF